MCHWDDCGRLRFSFSRTRRKAWYVWASYVELFYVWRAIAIGTSFALFETSLHSQLAARYVTLR